MTVIAMGVDSMLTIVATIDEAVRRERYLKCEQAVRLRPGALGLLPVEPTPRERNEKSPVPARGKG